MALLEALWATGGEAVMTDKRDPTELGLKLLEARSEEVHYRQRTGPLDGFKNLGQRIPLHELADVAPLHVHDYRDETTIEKYGDPRRIPSTMPNAIEG